MADAGVDRLAALDPASAADAPRLPAATRVFVTAFFVYEILYILGAFSTASLYVLPQSHRAISLGLLIVMTFLMRRAGGGADGRVPWYDWGLMAAGAAGCFYIAPTARIVALETASPIVPPAELALGIATLLVLLEGTRRVAGPVLPLLLAGFVGYAIFADRFPGLLYGRAHDFTRVIGELYLSLDGIFGSVMGLWTSVLVAFILFGAFLQASGAGSFFVRLALALTGHLQGGAAKVAVVASGLFATISGSAAADVATTGVVTVPMMKGMGYRPAFAGAVEAVASTGGVLMPPVMGMVAFLVAEFLDIPYLEVCIAAAIPAVLYYATLYLLVDLEARRQGLTGLARDAVPAFVPTLRQGWIYLVPIAVLLYYLAFRRYPPGLCAVYGVGALLFVTAFRPETRFTPRRVLLGFEIAARNTVIIAIVFGAVGILVASVAITGVALRMAVILVEASAGHLLLLMTLAGFASLVLGTGVPAVASYTLLAVTVAPALVQLGVPAIGAHLFVLYWGISHVITPPVGGTLYIASALSGVDIWRQGYHAMKLGLALFIVPFIFCYHPELLMRGSVGPVLWQTLLAALAMACFAMAAVGFLRRPLAPSLRLLLAAAGIAFIVQGPVGLASGMVVAVAVCGWQLATGPAGEPEARPVADEAGARLERHR